MPFIAVVFHLPQIILCDERFAVLDCQKLAPCRVDSGAAMIIVKEQLEDDFNFNACIRNSRTNGAAVAVFYLNMGIIRSC